jgi:hypothetical protein
MSCLTTIDTTYLHSAFSGILWQPKAESLMHQRVILCSMQPQDSFSNCGAQSCQRQLPANAVPTVVCCSVEALTQAAAIQYRGTKLRIGGI